MCNLRKTHVGNITAAQIDLSRAARALNQHKIILCFEPFKAFQHGADKALLFLAEVARRLRAHALALHNHLCASFAFGF